MLLKKLINIIRANALSEGKSFTAEDAERVFEEFYQRYAKGHYHNYKDSQTSNESNTQQNNSFSREKSHYDALELTFGSGFEEIKMAYKKLIKQYHPDRYHDDERKRQIAEKVTQQLNEAYSYFERKFGK